MQATYDYDFISIGSGPAGQRGAVQAAKLGRRAAVIERGRCVGGTCLSTGTIPSKTFREAVGFFSSLGGRFDRRRGPRSTARPTARDLLRRVEEVLEREGDVLRAQLERNEVDVIWGQASFKDRHTLVVEGAEGRREVSAANLLIATGTVPSPPPGAAEDGNTVVTSDGILGLERIPRTMTVIGAGVIGVEYATMFAALGVEVTLVDKRRRPLEFLDAEIVDELMHQMRNCHVSFRLGEEVSRLERVPGPRPRVAVFLESGKRIVSELVLFSVGRTGATEGLNLAGAGLVADARGRLAVDDQYRTTASNIFAAGDVIGYPSLAATSSMQGRIAACHAFGVAVESQGERFPIGIYSIPEISMVGSTEEELTKEKVPYEIGVARYREIARGQILGDDTGFFKMLFHRHDRRLLGVHILGSGATELLHIGQAVMELSGGLDYFLRAVFNYPTLAECYKVAALDAANKLSVSVPEPMKALAEV